MIRVAISCRRDQMFYRPEGSSCHISCATTWPRTIGTMGHMILETRRTALVTQSHVGRQSLVFWYVPFGASAHFVALFLALRPLTVQCLPLRLDCIMCVWIIEGNSSQPCSLSEFMRQLQVALLPLVTRGPKLCEFLQFLQITAVQLPLLLPFASNSLAAGPVGA